MSSDSLFHYSRKALLSAFVLAAVAVVPVRLRAEDLGIRLVVLPAEELGDFVATYRYRHDFSGADPRVREGGQPTRIDGTWQVARREDWLRISDYPEASNADTPLRASVGMVLPRKEHFLRDGILVADGWEETIRTASPEAFLEPVLPPLTTDMALWTDGGRLLSMPEVASLRQSAGVTLREDTATRTFLVTSAKDITAIGAIHHYVIEDRAALGASPDRIEMGFLYAAEDGTERQWPTDLIQVKRGADGFCTRITHTRYQAPVADSAAGFDAAKANHGELWTERRTWELVNVRKLAEDDKVTVSECLALFHFAEQGPDATRFPLRNGSTGEVEHGFDDGALTFVPATP